jgi:hypothetical protein
MSFASTEHDGEFYWIAVAEKLFDLSQFAVEVETVYSCLEFDFTVG